MQPVTIQTYCQETGGREMRQQGTRPERTGEFKWVEDPRQEHFAILSHVWAKDGDSDYPEQTYQDLLRFQEESRCADPAAGTLPISKFSDKLRRFCEIALKDGFEFGWADTCCIDKTSSSELSEAINSMYSWYAYSSACYAFLHDVDPPSEDSPKWQATFTGSQWFKRGWTLQELIASRIVIFVSKAPGADGDPARARPRIPGWEVLGSKHTLAACISSETGIDVAVLTFEKSLGDIPIARRMAWAQSRETSRLEDEAYCLMGIFGVNMQTNYGEGQYAFIRLQKQILSQSPDQTIFAWGRFLDDPSSVLLPSSPSSTKTPDNASTDLSHNPIAPPSFLEQYLLAPSPKHFDRKHSASMVRLSQEVFQQRLGISITDALYQVFEITPYGLKTHFPLLNVCSSGHHMTSATHCAILSCEDPDKGLLALLLRPRKHLTGNEFFVGAIVRSIGQKSGADEPFGRDRVWDDYCRLMYVTVDQLNDLRKSATSIFTLYRPRDLPTASSVYIPHCATRSAIELVRDSNVHAVPREMSERFEVLFCRWSKKPPHWQDSDVEPPFATSKSVLDRSSSSPDNAIKIWNAEAKVELIIQVARCKCDFGQRTGALGVLVSSTDPESLDKQFSMQAHPIDHRIHVHSWSFDHGFASREIEFDSPKDSVRRLSLRLTFTSIASQRASDGTTVRRCRLGAELRERGHAELQYPRQPLPLNPLHPIPNSPLPPLPLDLPGDKQLLRATEGGVNNGRVNERHLVDKGRVQTGDEGSITAYTGTY
ncbi:hypothetical protein GSI_05265 [Ganoderma sinense ZZ0214-1]|uniref:Uncharacterized protein n=1 Tax=Ganoderma sinense ZZ0214-1 TaxID=1077348 RepID=A0A2G8SFL9_9APHY|nr:hypothetical protein GSI_05265 [Ganoderma sinense ZZ0214-1]